MTNDWYDIKFLESAINVRELIGSSTGRKPSARIAREIAVCIQRVGRNSKAYCAGSYYSLADYTSLVCPTRLIGQNVEIWEFDLEYKEGLQIF